MGADVVSPGDVDEGVPLGDIGEYAPYHGVVSA